MNQQNKALVIAALKDELRTKRAEVVSLELALTSLGVGPARQGKPKAKKIAGGWPKGKPRGKKAAPVASEGQAAGLAEAAT